MRECSDCGHWTFQDWSIFNHECSQGRDTPDGGDTDAEDCPYFEPLSDPLGICGDPEDE